jgi:GT2 family glycosyltransferase
MMTSRARVTVVVPSYEGAPHLRRCLPALARQQGVAFEVIVVDNGSTDGSDGVVGEFPAARLLRLPVNRGYAGAANAGAALADGEFVAFLNNDTEPDERWLAELVACAERHPDAGAVDSKVLRADDPGVVDGAGDAMTRSLKAFRRGAGEPDDGRYDEEAEVFSASGTACLWRTAAFRRLGGFDETYFAYYEDVDLGFRSRLAGLECWYAPRAVVLHVGGATSKRVLDVDARYSLRNRWATATKNAPAAWLIRNAPLIAVGELMLWARFLRDGRPRLLARQLAAVGRSLPALLRARRDVQRSRSVAYRELISRTTGWFPSPRLR